MPSTKPIGLVMERRAKKCFGKFETCELSLLVQLFYAAFGAIGEGRERRIETAFGNHFQRKLCSDLKFTLFIDMEITYFYIFSLILIIHMRALYVEEVER